MGYLRAVAGVWPPRWLRQPMVDDVILRWKDVAWGVGVTLACVGRKVFVRKNFQKLHSISVL